MSLLNLKLKHQIVIAVCIYILWVMAFAYSNFNDEKVHLYNTLDKQLESAALTASLLLPDDLHHQNMAEGDISSQTDIHNVNTLSKFTDNTDIIYIYTLILRGNKIYFTSSSATPEEREAGEGLSNYFDHYDDVDPRVFGVFHTKQKSFLEYTDQWGSFRSVFIPSYSEEGSFYLAVADLSTDKIQSQLNHQLYQTIIISLLFLVFAYPLYFIATHFIHKKAKELEQRLQRKSAELTTNQQRLERALRSAKQAWFEINIPSGQIRVSSDYTALIGEQGRHYLQSSTIENWLNNIHPDDREATQEKFWQALQSDDQLTLEFRRKTAESGWIWIHASGQVIERDQQGNAITLVGINRDITDRKRNEGVLQTLAETKRTTNTDIFQLIVRELALSQNVRYAFIATVNDNSTQATTLALWANGQFVDNVSYSLAGTPCETVLDDTEIDFYSDHIQQLFPDDHMLVEMQACSYVGTSLRDSNDKVLGLISIVDDQPIAENKQTSFILNTLATRASIELENHQSNQQLQLYSHMFKNSHEGLLLLNDNDIIIDVNPAFCLSTGYSAHELLGQPAQMFRSVSHAYPAQFYDDIKQEIIRTGRWQGEVWSRKKNGEEALGAVTISATRNKKDETTYRFILVNDITKQKEQEEALHFMAHYDALTQLPNRTLFVDRFNQAAAHSKRSDTLLAICFLDLDNFKPINDNYGHEVGDQLLIEVAQRISSHIREGDTVSRQGGDEFTLLLGAVESFSQVEQMLIRILRSVSEPYVINNDTHLISASIGVTLFPLDDGDIDTLTRHADHAMYQAKQAGKNQYQLFDAIDDKQKNQLQQVQHELQHALLYGQLCLHYQPKVNMKTGLVFGVEALIRWQHPEQGMLFPLDFLPAAENTDLENKIGDWVIDKALSQMDKWQQQGIELEVSINISSHHLQSKSFISQLDKSLANHPNINSKYLQLEILESSALGDIDTISNIIKECQNTLGISIALDDFGTGYSSLTHLRNLSAQTIKIDRSFVMDLLDDPDDFAIINGIIGLAKAFDRDIIAEGVESTNHGLMLLAMGCDKAQGYGISRPIPAQDFPLWLKEYTPNKRWLNCGKKSHTEQQIKSKFVRLTTEKWFNSLENIIKSTDTTPVKIVSLCHLGVWLEQMRKDQLFSEQWVNDIHQLHDDLFALGEHAIQAYNDGHYDKALSRLLPLELTLKEITTLLEHHS